MMFTFLAVAAVPQALGMRPAATTTAKSAQFAKLQDLAKAARSDPSDPMTTLQEVASVVNTIMLQEGNATDHLTAADQQLLNDVITMIRDAMYGSMNTAQTADNAALTAAIAAINQCYVDFAAEVADGGDIKQLEDSARGHQTDLDALQDDVDEKTILNATAWSNLESHMSLISDAPSCPGLPNPRTMASLDVYFDDSPYVTWWTAQKAAYEPIRDAYLYAHGQLQQALTAYAVGLAVRNVAYCDWKRELEAGCSRYNVCYEMAKAHYLNIVKPAVEESMRMRIEAYKAGETIIHQIRFLLAQEADQATPSIDTSPYTIAFPEVPAKVACDMSALDDASWVPTPDCPLCAFDTPVFITSHAGNNLADHNGNVIMHPNRLSWETWTIHEATSPSVGVYITSHRNQQLADHNGDIIMHQNLLNWETWTITDAGDGEVFITSHRNVHLADHGNDVIVHQNTLDWERWTITKADGSPACRSPPPHDVRNLLDSCSTNGATFSAWGNPRVESVTMRAGEAVCCDDAGTCTRRISNEAGEFSGFSHENCITPDGGRLDDGVDTPSWTWAEAKAHCEAAGLRLPNGQQEMDTACGTGCHKDFTVAWTD